MKSDELKKVPDDKLNKIYDALEGEDIIAAQYAIRDCVIYDISDERIISSLKKLKDDGAIKIVKISSLAIAALDILGAEKYNGTDKLIDELIKTKFYTI